MPGSNIFGSDELFSDLSKLTEDERRIQVEFIEKRILTGLKDHDAFDLLEAESRLHLIGQIDPSDEVVVTVLKRLDTPAYHRDFDLIRISGYLRHPKVLGILEKHYHNLKRIWREQDEIRYFESHRIMLENVKRRAEDLSAMKVAADPYLNTLDQFFKKSFSDRKLQRFPELQKVNDNLMLMREQGNLSKSNIIALLDHSITRLQSIAESKTLEIESRTKGEKIKPNRVIAVYYCLLEALMTQGSSLVVIDEEFLEKVAQDFRAAYGSGTKRYVLNTLLRMRSDSFAEIAAEAQYELKAATVEKVERKESGEPGFRAEKVGLQEFQNYSLYTTAAEVIATNPVDEVFKSLLFSFNPAALLLGLRALAETEISGPRKLRHLRVLLDLGTMHEYVFSRAIEILSEVDSPAATATLAQLLTERYGWRKTRMPQRALSKIQNCVFNAPGSGSIAALATAFLKRAEMVESGFMTFPYEGEVYDTVLDKLAVRFERNLFHGINEIAQYRLFRALVNAVCKLRIGYALRGKKRALALIKTLRQVSNVRLEWMIADLKEALEVFESQVFKRVAGQDKTNAQDLLAEGKRTLQHLTAIKHQPSMEEKALDFVRTILEECFRDSKVDHYNEMRLSRALKDLHDLGFKRIRQREENVYKAADKSGSLDKAMLPVRYPASSRAIVRAGLVLLKYHQDTRDPKVGEILESLGIVRIIPPSVFPSANPSPEETKARWVSLQRRLSLGVPESGEDERLNDIVFVTAGACAHRMEDLLSELHTEFYELRKPPALRFAHLVALPVERDFISYWSVVLSDEDEAVFLAMKTFLETNEKERLKELIPDLFDLID